MSNFYIAQASDAATVITSAFVVVTCIITLYWLLSLARHILISTIDSIANHKRNSIIKEPKYVSPDTLRRQRQSEIAARNEQLRMNELNDVFENEL